MTRITKDLQSHWARIGPMLSIRNERDYDLAVKRLNELVDEIGTDKRRLLYGLLDALGTLCIHAYEEQHHPMPQVSGADMLRFFMERRQA